MTQIKKILIIADSTADLTNLANKLKNNYEIIWLTYHKSVYFLLKKKKFKKVYLCSLDRQFAKNFFFKKYIQKIINKFSIVFSLSRINGFLDKIKQIDKKENPTLFITDTMDLLRFYKTKKKKISFGHSVTYKKFFLFKHNLNYNYLFLPGFYHLNRIKNYFSLKKTDNLKILGSLKISPFLSPIINKKKFNKKYALKYNTNVLFAPTHDAHNISNKLQFLPPSYGEQFEILENIATYLDKLKANLIIKLHHYHEGCISQDRFKKFKNVLIFKSGSFFNTENSNEFIKNSDVIITDTSGVATTGIYLNKKMIFIEPTSKEWNWAEADIEKKFRPGFVCNNYHDLQNALRKSFNGKDIFKKRRKNFVKILFYKPNKDAAIEISEFIKCIL